MIRAAWPAPDNVVALTTTRHAPAGTIGASEGAYADFNLAQHVHDKPLAVAANRAALFHQLQPQGLRRIQWLNQTHGTAVYRSRADVQALPDADAAITTDIGQALAVLTADCLPVLLCDRSGRQVAAVHAGWRGLCSGVVANAVAAFDRPAQQLMAWLGPAISPKHFEVGEEVLQAFQCQFSGPDTAAIRAAFVPAGGHSGKYLADLYQLARLQLKSLGVDAIYGGEYCTVADEDLFYSYRRQPQCGRQASIILLRDN